MKVTVNSDDPAYFGAYVQQNLMALAQEAELTRDELVALQADAFDIAWLSPRLRKQYLAELRSFAVGH